MHQVFDYMAAKTVSRIWINYTYIYSTTLYKTNEYKLIQIYLYFFFHSGTQIIDLFFQILKAEKSLA